MSYIPQKKTISILIIVITTLILSISGLSGKDILIKSSYTLRVTNRKYISHILYEYRRTRHYITLITTHGPSYHAFYSRSHALYYQCGSPKHCLYEIKKLDDYLKKGYNIGLRLHGSKVIEIIYYKK